MVGDTYVDDRSAVDSHPTDTGRTGEFHFTFTVEMLISKSYLQTQHRGFQAAVCQRRRITDDILFKHLRHEKLTSHFKQLPETLSSPKMAVLWKQNNVYKEDVY